MPNILQLFFFGAELIGTVAFAISGAMLAIDRDLDLFGILCLGVITAVGGGIIRDIILGTFPPNAFTNSVYVGVAFVSSLAVFLYAVLKEKPYWQRRQAIDRANNFLDAVGLGIFSVIGAQTAMNKGYLENAFLCILMGMMTGVGGGVLRDMLSQEIPAVLKKRIYAVASIAGAGAYYVLVRMNANGPVAMIAGMFITVLIRMLATRYAWDLPKVHRQS